MKTLYLLRHAKSSWKDSDLKDIKRPLKKRGHFQADLVSDHLSSLVPPPQQVLCSPSVRTRETLLYFLEVWPLNREEIQYQKSLYLADKKTLLESVQALPADRDIVLLVGHNPGLTDFAQKLLQAESEELSALRTSAFLQIDFDVERWEQVRPHTGSLKLHLSPKDLEG
ncbi:histidine phosphatase family protein [Kiritimatiellaeota bacterium B1221]|nr:histidine phosphatase family protein [Kiritimatiellaeota bacterium B1221]